MHIVTEKLETANFSWNNLKKKSLSYTCLFPVLDELKNMKASVKNDYATYRRAAQFLKVMSDSHALQESQNLSMFLATQGKIRDNLKDTLKVVKNHEELFCDIINTCLTMFESKTYLTPAEKHVLVKVMGFSLFLIDSDQVWPLTHFFLLFVKAS